MRNKIYARILRFSLKWKYIMVTLPLAIIIITVGLFAGGLIRVTFFPVIQFDFF